MSIKNGLFPDVLSRRNARRTRCKLVREELDAVKKAVRIVYTAICVAVIVAGSVGMVPKARPSASEPESPVFAEAPETAPPAIAAPPETAVPEAAPSAPKTREQAAVEAYAELAALGAELPGEAGSIAVFADAADISPEARTPVAKLCMMGVMPVSGAYFRPDEPISEEDAALLEENLRLAEEGGLDPLAALGAEKETALEACRSVCSAMLALGMDRFEAEPDARLAYAALARAAGSGLFECSTSAEGFEFRRVQAEAALARIFAGKAPEQPDPTASDPPPLVRGESIVLPAPEDRVELVPGALVPDGEGGARFWCELREDGNYCCCALIFLEEGRLASVELCFG